MTEIFFLDDSDDFNAGSLNDQDYEPELKTRTGGERGRKKKRKQDTTDTKRSGPRTYRSGSSQSIQISVTSTTTKKSSSGAATGDIRGTSDFKRQLKRRCRDNEASHLDKTQVNRLEVLALNSEILDSQVMVNSEVKNISAEMKRIADVLEKCFELYCQNILPPEL
ncbi:unnamed protein product [Nesidiocoris tenuis]|uniref:Uncharacterized protein n=1 Tax=Nesidiocoris tenuis TaxID=355587 RepID=A0A6H5GGS9_9HEMI|nr:unnamed protein product [Nesidiocoris tenuis]